MTSNRQRAIAARITPAALVAFALVCTVIVGMFVGMTNGPMSWGSVAGAMFKFLRLPSLDQWLLLVLWAALTGTLFTIGAGTNANHIGTRLLGFISGIALPLGLVFLVRWMSRFWPNATSLIDHPPLTICLVLYGLAVPWLLGRIACSFSPMKV
jgi:hypothetical protein